MNQGDQRLEQFLVRLRKGLDKQIDDTAMEVAKFAKKTLEELSPSKSVKIGKRQGEGSPYSMGDYRQNHNISKDSSTGKITITNPTFEDSAEFGYPYGLKVEYGWARNDGSTTPGYYVYTQAAEILKHTYKKRK